MSEMIREIFSPELAFLRCALLVGLLAAPTLGVVGSLVVTRRISSLAGACAHAALGGVGLALFLQRVVRLAWCTPTLGAVAGALLSAVVVGVGNVKWRMENEELADGTNGTNGTTATADAIPVGKASL